MFTKIGNAGERAYWISHRQIAFNQHVKNKIHLSPSHKSTPFILSLRFFSSTSQATPSHSAFQGPFSLLSPKYQHSPSCFPQCFSLFLLSRVSYLFPRHQLVFTCLLITSRSLFLAQTTSLSSKPCISTVYTETSWGHTHFPDNLPGPYMYQLKKQNNKIPPKSFFQTFIDSSLPFCEYISYVSSPIITQTLHIFTQHFFSKVYFCTFMTFLCQYPSLKHMLTSPMSLLTQVKNILSGMNALTSFFISRFVFLHSFFFLSVRLFRILMLFPFSHLQRPDL